MEPCAVASSRSRVIVRGLAARFLILSATLAAATGIALPRAWAAASPTTTSLVVTSPGFAVKSVAAGTVVTLTAVVVSGSTRVEYAGQVKFCDASAKYCEDSALLATAQVTKYGTATLTFRPAIGSHSYQAVFVGNSNYATSASTATALTVTGLYPATTTIASSGSIGNYSLTATVVGSGSRTLSPSGSVSFLDTTNANASLGAIPLGTATLGQTFTATSASTVNCCPGAVVAGDFNKDGIPDIATLADGVTVLLGNADGTFNVEPAINVSADSIAVGDFNGDGIPDLVTTDFSTSTVTVLLSKGNGSFTTQPAVTVGAGPEAVVTADFNGDGILDLATVNCGTTSCSSGAAVNSVTVLLGNGDGTFTTSKSTTVPGAGPPSCLVAGDFNGDGIPDLATCDSGVSVLLGNGDGTFAAKPTVTIPDGSDSLAVGDFNGDGVADLAVLGSATVTVLLGNGDGTFTTKSTIDAPYGIDFSSIVTGDFNGDGVPDLVMTQPAGDSIVLSLGDGKGSFTTSSFGAGVNSIGYPPDLVAVADFNGDGLPDLAISFQDFSLLAVMLNQITQTATATLSDVSVSGAEIHQLEASYPGDANYAASASSPVPLLAAKLATTLALSSNSTSFPAGTQIMLTASLSPSSIGSTSTDGETVTFYSGGTSVGTGTLSSGTATLTLDSLPVGSYSLTAGYAGDANFSATTSAAVVLQATKITTSLQLSSSTANGPSAFQLVLSATVSPSGSGIFFNDGETVTFYQGGKMIGTGTLSSGVATLNINPLAAGSYAFEASYPGDTNFAAVDSPTYNIVAPSLEISSTPGSSVFGSQVTLTATLSPYSSSGSSTDGETITFYSRGINIGTAPLSSGVAMLNTTSLPVGPDALTATYPGDASFLGVLSNSLLETVKTVSGAVQTYVVTTTADDASGVAANCTGAGTPNCSLRDALAAAAADGAGNITFASSTFSTPQTITLNNDSLFMSSNTAVTGPPAGVTVNGGSIGQYYNSVFVVGGGAVNVSMTNLTITEGPGIGVQGGGINNAGQLTVTNSHITGIDADNYLPCGCVYGAGIYNGGTMTLTNSSVSGNGMFGRETGAGGGIYNGGTLTAINSSISGNDICCNGSYGNTGGGIANFGTLILSGSSVQGNFAYTGYGAGIENGGYSGSILIATNSNISGNSSEGPPNVYTEDDCDYYYYDDTGCLVNGVNGNVSGPPQPNSPTAATPKFNPRAGSYYSPQPITITDTTPGAIIFYSTDGLNWTRYVVPITVSSTETLQAIAVAVGYTESLVATNTYTFPLPAAEPVFSPPSGTYTSPQTVTITDTTPGATIYYTTDGTLPGRSSPIFNPMQSISVSATQTIKALAVAPGYATSPEGVATYTIIPPYAATPVFTLPTGFYTSRQTVSITDTTPGATIYYTTDGTPPTTSSTRYTTGPLAINSTERIEAIAVAPNYSPSAVAIGTFFVAAAQPLISPSGGNYSTPQMITITDTTPAAVIYYTTDGTLPGRSSPSLSSGGSILVSSSETIKALAVASGYTTSPEGFARFTITP